MSIETNINPSLIRIEINVLFYVFELLLINSAYYGWRKYRYIILISIYYKTFFFQFNENTKYTYRITKNDINRY